MKRGKEIKAVIQEIKEQAIKDKISEPKDVISIRLKTSDNSLKEYFDSLDDKSKKRIILKMSKLEDKWLMIEAAIELVRGDKRFRGSVNIGIIKETLLIGILSTITLLTSSEYSELSLIAAILAVPQSIYTAKVIWDSALFYTVDTMANRRKEKR